MILIRKITLIGIFTGLCAALTVGLVGLPERPGKADIAVVFGTTVNPDGRPSRRLAARLDKAVSLFRAGFFPCILVSGGLGKEGFQEGSVMKGYLIEHGVSVDRIFVDNEGDNTYKTARNTSVFVREHKMETVLLVSQFFHLPRARLAFTRFGMPHLYYGHPDYYETRDLYSLGREVLALCAYWVSRYPVRT